MGYDPNTVNQQSDFRMKFMLRASTGEIGGDLLVSFQGHTVEMPAGGDILTTEACTRGFRRFQNLGDVVRRMIVAMEKVLRFLLNVCESMIDV